MKIYIVRHGESETNLQKKWTGWLDVNLTDKGVEDANKIRERFSRLSFDKAYSSDLTRARRTAEIALPNCKIETSPLLREINVGTFAGEPLSFVKGFTPEQTEAYRKSAFKEFGGESLDDMDERVKSFVGQLQKTDYERVAVFTHAGWQRSMLDFLLGFRFPRGRVFFGNCAVIEAEYNGQVWRLTGIRNLD